MNIERKNMKFSKNLNELIKTNVERINRENAQNECSLKIFAGKIAHFDANVQNERSK